VKVPVVLLCCLAAACSWSNSLYQARAVSAEALRYEREESPGEAENAWGRAAVKAESAYARGPEGAEGAEALWLGGRAYARSRDCVRATKALEASLVQMSNAAWREPLLYELARCRDALQDPGAAALYVQLAMSSDTAMRHKAQRLAGAALVRNRQWEEALHQLQDVEGPQARVSRAVALAALGRTEAAVAEVRPLLITADTTLDFTPLVEIVASQSSARADSLLIALYASPLRTADLETRWLLAAVQGELRHNPANADLRLAQLLSHPSNPSVRTGQVLAADRMVARSESPNGLLSRLDSLSGVADEGLPQLRAAELRRIGNALFEEERATSTGAPRGDLTLFALAEVARDSLNAAQLSAWLFARLEHDWPQSAYLPKSLLARMPLLPDSVEALQARLMALPPNPYLAYLHGAQDEHFIRLEDSMRVFNVERALAATGRRAGAGTVVDK
jgi:hypothetical protein